MEKLLNEALHFVSDLSFTIIHDQIQLKNENKLEQEKVDVSEGTFYMKSHVSARILS
jgi:hypothetical protein